MFVYIEYISRRPGVTLEEFRALVGYSQPRWSKLFPEDRLVLLLGRTWRVGSEPEYLAVWANAASGIERIDAWESSFESIEPGSELAVIEHGFLAAARIDSGGVMRALIEPIAGTRGPYYAEFFDFPAETDDLEIDRLFSQRTALVPGAVLHVLARRTGLLGPDPGLAVWSAGSYADLEPIINGSSETGAIRSYRAALYADLGREVL
jgi:hypothetical protein